MERYDFEIVDGERKVVVVEREVAIADNTAMWLRIAAIARRVGARGRLIRVRKAGGIVVLIGAATALQLCADLINNLPPL